MTTKPIYLDYNATTPIAEPVKQAMVEAMNLYGNASSVYALGEKSRTAIEEARASAASLLGCNAGRIVFTGCGSESNNTVLKGIALKNGNTKKQVITSSIEHPSVLVPCYWLQNRGFDVTFLPVDEYGRVRSDDLRDTINDDTFLVSIMLANNETGVIQPVAELAEIAHRHGALFHTDAVQAVGKIPVNVKELGVDFLSISGHKLHAPKGIGVLYVREGTEPDSLIVGGSQERGLRAGTENIVGIVGLGKASEIAFDRLPKMDRIRQLRDKLHRGIAELIPGTKLNGHPEQRLPNTANLMLPGIGGGTLVLALDQQGVLISSGSACHAGSADPPYSLTAMGLSDEEALCSVRLSLGFDTTLEEIEKAIGIIGKVISRSPEKLRYIPHRQN